ncbi:MULTISPECIES: BRO-N domain-containing protein [Rhizobium/Agrobacterium group]|uniref:BRO-N domain-containing protein n=1 Tax=Rhizobium oryzihabitans TaxID=2267833 RepID=UPI004033C6E0
MSKDKFVDKHGLSEPIDEALKRFSKLTVEEIEEQGLDKTSLIPDGEFGAIAFKGVEIRKLFHKSEWWFSIVDVVGALTDSTNARRYWSDLKAKMLKDEGFDELYEEIVQLKMESPDGKLRDTDAANAETLFRIIQSVPSPKAEPFRRWLAKVAYERIQEIQDPEIAIKRAIMEYQLQGRSMDWIEQRIRSIMVRKELTNEWKKRGVDESHEFAILTSVLSTRTFGVNPSEHKKLKRIQNRHNLRDHMTDLELILTQLAEKSTKEIAQIRDAQGFNENKVAARVGGDIAGNARRSLEKETGRRVVSDSNFLPKDKPRLK